MIRPMRAATERGNGWRWALPRILLLFLVARLLVIVCAAGVETLAHPDPAGPDGSTLRATDRPILASLTSWDAVYYLEIARNGYQPGPVNGPYPEIVFFPLYPAVVAAVAPLFDGDLPLAAAVVGNLGGLAGLVAVYALARRRLSPRASILTTGLVGLNPGAVAFSMAYSDGLFLALSAGSLYLAERGGRGSRPAAAALSALAGLTRLQGALLIVPLLVLFWRQDARRARASWLWSLGGPIGLAAFCVFVGGVAGDPLIPITAQGAWELGAVPGAVADAWVLMLAALVYGATALVELRLLWDRWRSASDPAGVAWAVVNVAAMAVARRVASLPRYMAPVTQLAEQLAGGGYAPRTVRLVVAGSVCGYVVLALLHFGLELAP
ncbi:MAG: hypothetical protein QOH61_1162 [Chloroflexota bacterium]|jgi:hypothetical protein|nr:hypothetical protein [Chloroflexota bacterium]